MIDLAAIRLMLNRIALYETFQTPSKPYESLLRALQQQHAQWEFILISTMRFSCHGIPEKRTHSAGIFVKE
jgi:hypothetical protein